MQPPLSPPLQQRTQVQQSTRSLKKRTDSPAKSAGLISSGSPSSKCSTNLYLVARCRNATTVARNQPSVGGSESASPGYTGLCYVQLPLSVSVCLISQPKPENLPSRTQPRTGSTPIANQAGLSTISRNQRILQSHSSDYTVQRANQVVPVLTGSAAARAPPIIRPV